MKSGLEIFFFFFNCVSCHRSVFLMEVDEMSYGRVMESE